MRSDCYTVIRRPLRVGTFKQSQGIAFCACVILRTWLAAYGPKLSVYMEAAGVTTSTGNLSSHRFWRFYHLRRRAGYGGMQSSCGDT